MHIYIYICVSSWLPKIISQQQLPQVEIPPVHPLGCMEVAQHSDALARERENYWADEVA